MMTLRLILALAFLFSQGPTTVAPKTTLFPNTTVAGGTVAAGTTWSIAHSALVYNNQGQGVAKTLGWTTTAAATTIEYASICEGGATNNVSSITDNATGGTSTWQTSGAGSRGSDASTAITCETWFSYIKSGATTMTINTAGGNVWAYVYELNGIATASPVDVVGNCTTCTGSGTSNVGASLTTGSAGDFIAGADAPDAGSITACSAGYTADSTASGIGFCHFTSTAAAAGAHQITYTNTSSGDHYTTTDATFKHN